MYNILLAGVGGQGTVLASKILAACAMAQGKAAHTAETIGMAQRGGSVVSHVRVGDNVFSPLIPHGQADVLIGFEPAEAVRCLPYLKQGGTVVVSTAAVKPVTDSLSDTQYSGDEMLAFLQKQNVRLVMVDGEKLVKEMGSARSLNIALLGAAAKAGALGDLGGQLQGAMESQIKPKFLQINLQALRLGESFVQ